MVEGQNIFRLFSRILIAFGILLINLFIFTALALFICKALYKIDMGVYLNSDNFEHPTENQISAIRMFQGIVSVGTFLVSSFVIALSFKQKPLEYLGLKGFPKPLFLIAIPVLLLVSIPCLSWLLELNNQLKLPSFLASFESQIKTMELKNEKLYDLMLTMDGYGALISNLLVMALIPAIGEELFCRGVLLNVVYDYSGKFFRSVITVAFIFTLFHMQLYKFVPMMLLAIVLGLFINWTHSIWASILFHFLNNSFAVVTRFYYDKGYVNFFTDEHATMPLLVVVASFLISIAIVVFLNRKTKEWQPKEPT